MGQARREVHSIFARCLLSGDPQESSFYLSQVEQPERLPAMEKITYLVLLSLSSNGAPTDAITVEEVAVLALCGREGAVKEEKEEFGRTRLRPFLLRCLERYRP